jgi:hypothetical protein
MATEQFVMCSMAAYSFMYHKLHNLSSSQHHYVTHIKRTSITKTNQLLLFQGILFILRIIKHLIFLCGQSSKFSNVKAAVTYS